MFTKKQLFRVDIQLQASLYIIAGLAHLIFPEYFIPLIPEYFPELELINLAAGFWELSLATLVFIPYTRKIASYLLGVTLLCYSLSHIHFIRHGSCFEGSLCVPAWIAWLRLTVIHPLLIFWSRRIMDYHK